MRLTKSFWWAVASIVLMVVGALGPWAKVLTLTINGTDDGKDGWVVVGAAAVAALGLLLCLLVRRWGPALLVLLAAFASGATAGYDIRDTHTLESNAGLGASTGWGLYVALVGSISLLLASIGVVVETRRARRASDAVSTQPPPAA
jgi:hypothetical protein